MVQREAAVVRRKPCCPSDNTGVSDEQDHRSALRIVGRMTGEYKKKAAVGRRPNRPRLKNGSGYSTPIVFDLFIATVVVHRVVNTDEHHVFYTVEVRFHRRLNFIDVERVVDKNLTFRFRLSL